MQPTQQYFTGHVRAENKDHLIDLSNRAHGKRLQAFLSEPTPPSWDSRSQGWVGPVKNQKSCGSCWDFSGVGIVEAAYNKAGVGGGAGTFVLSEEYVLSCCRSGGCGGDDNVTVLAWAKSHGLPLTTDYGPYTANRGVCQYKPTMNLYKVDAWGFADSNGGNGVCPTPDIKSAIMQYGAVGCGIAADNSFMNWSGGVFNGSGSTQINHDIILVGWDDNPGYWILRNSWGGSWCEQGYMKIAYGANNVGNEAVWCGINASAPPIDWYA